MLVILKIAERCNLDCSYCYMYFTPDQSWRTRPRFLSEDDERRLIERLVEQRRLFPESQLQLELHGGEPLLVGVARLRRLLDRIRDRPELAQMGVGLQTNGLLLDDAWYALFDEMSVSFGISSDGPPQVHDRFRRYADGRGSGEAVAEAIRRSVGHRCFSGVLAVADPRADGAEVVRWFYGLGVRSLDLLLPDANHVFRLENCDPVGLRTYLLSAFDAWIALQDPAYKVRKFQDMILGVMGQPSSLDAMGGSIADMVVVESDGSYQLLDVLHICGEAEVTTPFHLREHPLTAVGDHARGRFPPPSATCTACPCFAGCGGGYLPHRWDGASYDNPTVYCELMKGWVGHVQAHLARVTPPSLWRPRVGG